MMTKSLALHPLPQRRRIYLIYLLLNLIYLLLNHAIKAEHQDEWAVSVFVSQGHRRNRPSATMVVFGLFGGTGANGGTCPIWWYWF